MNREYQRGAGNKNKSKLVYENKADLLNFMRENALPNGVEDMEDGKMYAVDVLADYWHRYPDTIAMALVTQQSVRWVGQLVELEWSWALHGDGKHKLHHGRWILMTFGTHCLRWDANCKTYRHTFIPLIYIFSKQHETIESVQLSMDCLQMVADHFYSRRLCPAAVISDHADGFMVGMQRVNVDFDCDADEAEVPKTPRLGDWAHVATKYKKGQLLAKSSPFYGEFWHYLRALHLTHSTEMMGLVRDTICQLIEEYESKGAETQGGRTMSTLRAEYIEPCDFSIGAYDGMTK